MERIIVSLMFVVMLIMTFLFLGNQDSKQMKQKQQLDYCIELADNLGVTAVDDVNRSNFIKSCIEK